MRDGVEDIAYRMDALSSNSMKSANPHSGFHRIEVAPTLDTFDLTSAVRAVTLVVEEGCAPGNH